MNSLQRCWQPSPILCFTYAGRKVGSIPLDFLTTGQVANWSYIRYVLRAVVVLPVNFELYDADKQVNEDTVILPKTYNIVTSEQIEPEAITFTTGPQGKSLSCAQQLNDQNETDTVSASSQASRSPDQTAFQQALLARDGRCLVTGAERLQVLTGCHIVFQSLGQSYLDEVLGAGSDVIVMDVRNRLLLNNVLHHPYDRFSWGIYYKEADNAYYIHLFKSDPQDPTSSRYYHGHRLLLNDTFKGKWPHQALLDWQYCQCLMAQVRGFKHGELL